MRTRSVGVILMALMTTAAALPWPAVAPPVPGQFPQVYVTLSAVAPINVDADADVFITTNGTVNVTLFSFVETRVNLTVEVRESYWDATIEPTSVTLTGSGEIPFVVNATIPGRAPAGSDNVIFVNANVSTTNYPVGRDFSNQTPVPIEQYFGVALTAGTTSSPDRFDAPAGAPTNFAFRLQNTGNGGDTFEIRVLNLADLQASGISLDIPSPTASVSRGVTVIRSGTVTLPPSITLGDYPIQIEAASVGALAKSADVTGTTTKTIHAVEQAPPGGGDGTDNNTTPPPKPFLPGPSAGATLSAFGAVALFAAWRRFRPPSQGATCRVCRAPSRGRAR